MSFYDQHDHYFSHTTCLENRQVALSNSFPKTCVPSREVVCPIFLMVFGVVQTHYQLSHLDAAATVLFYQEITQNKDQGGLRDRCKTDRKK